MKTPFWLAQRHGQDWRNDSIVSLIEWFATQTDSARWSQRMDAIRAHFDRARLRWLLGDCVPVHPGNDRMAWYVFQAQAFASNRRDCFVPDTARLAPVFSRLAAVRTELEQIGGVNDRVSALMKDRNADPDTDLFELLVGAAYKRRGWRRVNFLEPARGRGKTVDLTVEHGRRHWAVECKRMEGGGQYEREETEHAERLAAPIHAFARSTGLWLHVSVRYHDELKDLPTDFLLEAVAQAMSASTARRRREYASWLRIVSLDPRPLLEVLKHDLVFYRSTRMVELLTGDLVHGVEYSMRADWTPASDRPFYAEQVRHASVVGWQVRAPLAERAKTKHFRSKLAHATAQLPGDRPGVVHFGYESTGQNAMDGQRAAANRAQVQTFEPGQSRLRWVYINHWAPEKTTKRLETWANPETTVPLRVGRHSITQPLPGHLLFDDADGKPGAHWI